MVLLLPQVLLLVDEFPDPVCTAVLAMRQVKKPGSTLGVRVIGVVGGSATSPNSVVAIGCATDAPAAEEISNYRRDHHMLCRM